MGGDMASMDKVLIMHNVLNEERNHISLTIDTLNKFAKTLL